MGCSTRLAWLGILLLVLLASFWPTLESIVAIWSRSETFAHGFLVLPVAAFLIWRQRAVLSCSTFRTDLSAFLLLVLTGFAWLAARVTDVLVVEQFAAVAIVIWLVWLVLGWGTVRLLAFPLGFLFFAVPIGEGLIEPLMGFTAVFTVGMLRLTGIPVFSDGTFFSIPSGDWSVVEACSGLRYLIASVFLGVLYAYLSYRSLWRRVAFISLSVVVPILANGMRAYLIVMIGHLSGMKLAVGIDHLIYGWVFFGLVMFVLFAIGNLWAERKTTADSVMPVETHSPASLIESRATTYRGLLLGLAFLIAWPALAGYVDSGRGSRDLDLSNFELPQASASWQREEASLTGWVPRYLGYTMDTRQDYRQSSDKVGLYLTFYGGGEGELVNSQNVMVPQKDDVWRMPRQEPVRVPLGDKVLSVIEAKLQSEEQSLLTWHWYWIDGHHTSNEYLAKIYEAKALLLGRGNRQAGIVLYTPMSLKTEPARARLRRFAADMIPALDARLRDLAVTRNGSSSGRR